jgi:hypothetical protein
MGSAQKFEIRSTKFETNRKVKTRNSKQVVSPFLVSDFRLRVCFGFRYSRFEFRMHALVGLVGVLTLCGCGSSSIAPVTGRVTCKGKPVAEASLTFSPAPKTKGDQEPGKPATGFTDAEGIYVLSTYRNLDGALLGNHNVTVVLDDTNPARCPRQKQLTLEVKPGANEFNIELSP